MKQTWSENALDRLYRGSARDAAPAAIDTPVLAAARSRAQRTRWMRRSMLLLPVAAVAFAFWQTASVRHSAAWQAETLATASLRGELARAGTPKPAAASAIAAYLLNASPYAAVESERSAAAQDGNRP